LRKRTSIPRWDVGLGSGAEDCSLQPMSPQRLKPRSILLQLRRGWKAAPFQNRVESKQNRIEAEPKIWIIHRTASLRGRTFYRSVETLRLPRGM